MLHVEKKKQRPKKKWTLWILLIVLALACAFFAMRMFREEVPLPERVDTRGSLVNREVSEISSIRIQLRGRGSWTVVRNPDGNLALDGTEGFVIDETLGERLEDALAHLVYEDILTENPEDYQNRLADFGLDDPALLAEVQYTDGSGLTLRIGNDSGLHDMDYRFMIIDGDPRLYAVAGNLMEDLEVEQELLHPVEQPEIQVSRLDRITVLDEADQKIAEWTLNGQITDTDAAAKWLVTAPVIYPADQDQIASLKKNAGNLRLGLYVGDGSPDSLAAAGLDHPKYRIEVHLAAGSTGQITDGGAYDVRDWPSQTLSFRIGSPRNDMTDYCLYEGAVYTMNHFTVASLTELDPMDTLARYPVVVPLEILSSLEVARTDGGTDLYELTRTYLPSEASAGNQSAAQDADPAGQTVITCQKNGADLPYAVFEAAYERLLVVDVSGRLPDGWAKRESTVTYTFRTLSGDAHVLELSPFDAMHDAVTVDGWTLFYLIRGGMPELP